VLAARARTPKLKPSRIKYPVVWTYFDLIDLTSPGRKHADRRSPITPVASHPRMASRVVSANSPITALREAYWAVGLWSLIFTGSPFPRCRAATTAAITGAAGYGNDAYRLRRCARATLITT
jgi:hypothetical protein